jgi:hypothetical protein
VKTNPKVETAPETPTGVRTAKNTPSQEQFTDEALRRMAQNPATRDKAIRIIEARRAAAGAKGGSTQGSAQMRAALAQARSKRAYKPTGRGFIN